MRESRQGLREKHESHESEYVFSQSVRLGLLASNIYEHAQDAFRGIFGVLACRAVSGSPERPRSGYLGKNSGHFLSVISVPW